MSNVETRDNVPCLVKTGNLATDETNRNILREEDKTMKKSEQAIINSVVMENMEKAIKEYEQINCKPVRLRSCSAWVYETENYYLLKSYNTFIACMDKTSENVYDALRLVYGFTRTSVQHISKFDALTCYGGYKRSYNNHRYTAR